MSEAGGSKEIDRIGPSYWPIIVGVEGPNVTVGVPCGCYVLDAAEQERFAQAYVAACHQGEGQRRAEGERLMRACDGDRHYYAYDSDLRIWVCVICGDPE